MYGLCHVCTFCIHCIIQVYCRYAAVKIKLSTLQATLASNEACDLVSETGSRRSLATIDMTDREELIDSLTQYHLLVKVKCSVDQFIRGLENVGILSLIRSNPEVWKPLFVYTGAHLTILLFQLQWNS